MKKGHDRVCRGRGSAYRKDMMGNKKIVTSHLTIRLSI